MAGKEAISLYEWISVAEYKLEIGEIVKRNTKGGDLGDRKGEMTEAQTC